MTSKSNAAIRSSKISWIVTRLERMCNSARYRKYGGTRPNRPAAAPASMNNWSRSFGPSIKNCREKRLFEFSLPILRSIGTGFRPPRTCDKAVLSLRRDTSIASVIEKEVLAKHRKALMLMGTLHLLHGAGATAMIEAKHANSIFVISEFGVFGENSTDPSKALFASWPIPAIARVKDTSLGRLDLKAFLPPPYTMDQDCKPHTDFTGPLRKPVEELFDAVLYLGPLDLRLREKIPADVVLDTDYMKELHRRAALPGSATPAVQVSDELDRQISAWAENPLFKIDAPPLSAAVIEQAVRDCRERQHQPPPK